MADNSIDSIISSFQPEVGEPVRLTGKSWGDLKGSIIKIEGIEVPPHEGYEEPYPYFTDTGGNKKYLYRLGDTDYSYTTTVQARPVKQAAQEVEASARSFEVAAKNAPVPAAVSEYDRAVHLLQAELCEAAMRWWQEDSDNLALETQCDHYYATLEFLNRFHGVED